MNTVDESHPLRKSRGSRFSKSILRSLLPACCFFGIATVAGCSTDVCGGTWCVRITNEHQENSQPVYIQLLQCQGGMGGLPIQSVAGKQLAPGGDTGWFDISMGTSRSCSDDSVCFHWRAQPDESWSDAVLQVTPVNAPNCFVKGQNYDLILR
jgi:hypothetical protein